MSSDRCRCNSKRRYIINSLNTLVLLLLFSFCLEVVCPDEPAWRAIIGQFGVEVLQEDKTLDRKRLAEIIFNDEEKRRTLNRITHPYIQKKMMFQLLKYFLKGVVRLKQSFTDVTELHFQGERMVVLVSPLLFETNRFLSIMKRIITVNWYGLVWYGLL